MATDEILSTEYKEKNPGATATDEEINAYYQAHPTAFDDFINSDPRIKEQMDKQTQMMGPQAEMMKAQAKKGFGEMKVIAERARSENLDQDDVIKMKLLLLGRGNALVSAYMQDLEKNVGEQIKPEDAESFYQSQQRELDEVKVRHIMLISQPGTGTPEERRKKAEEILVRARNGEDFAQLATEFSDDTTSKMKGGDLDYVWKGDGLPEEFKKAMLALQPGQMSDVVESSFGFHIIKVEDRRPKPSPASDENARKVILDFMKQERIQKRVDEIVASGNVEIAEDFNTTPKPVERLPLQIPGHGGQP
jgi:hypothetical protein